MALIVTEAKKHVARLLAAAMSWSRHGDAEAAARLLHAATKAKRRLRKQSATLDVAYTAVLHALYAAHGSKAIAWH